MTTVKLIRGLSYLGYGVRVTRQDPILRTDDEKAARLIASGFFIAVPQDTPEPPRPVHEDRPITKYDTMNIKQLRAAAAELGVDLTGCKTKAAITNALANATLKDGPDINPMIVLQEEQ